jgi:hypothetical protein
MVHDWLRIGHRRAGYLLAHSAIVLDLGQLMTDLIIHLLW